MSLLPGFISFLNTEERNQLASMPLPGKEKILRDIFVSELQAEPSKRELMQRLGLSSSHYDKLSTVVLKKAYRFFGGDDPLEQLNFLSRKFMFHHLFHEIRSLRLKMNGVTESRRESFLRALFDFSINVPARYYDEKFVTKGAEDYLEHVKKDRPARELEVKAKILFARLNLLAQQPPNKSAVKRIHKEIQEAERKYKNVDDARAKAILYHVWVNFYRMVKPDYRQRKKYLQKIAALYGGNEKMPEFERAISACHEAEILFERSEYDAAYYMYGTIITQRIQLLRNQFHHFARWIELAIILGKYNEAEQLLNTLFKMYVENNHESNGVLGAILYSELYLATGDLDKAYHYLSLSKSLNSIQVYFTYEIRIRALETLYFGFAGDFDFSRRLALRNIRYVQLQRLSLKQFKYAHFYTLLKDFITIRRSYPKYSTPKVNAYIKEFDKGYDKILGILYHRLLHSPNP